MKLFRSLYLQVLLGIAMGVLVGSIWPAFGATLEPLGLAFVNVIKMLIAPIIFTTIVSGIAAMGDLRKLGSVGWKSLLYFEAVTTVALLIGLAVAHALQPGAGIPAPEDAVTASHAVEKYTSAAASLGTVEFLMKIIPKTFVGAFSEGEILQVLFLAILSGIALAGLGERGRPLSGMLHQVAQLFFGIVGIVTRAAPLAAFGAMAFTVGKYGLGTLKSLGLLLACVYITCALFIFVVLGLIARLHGFSLWRTLGYIKEELLIVLGTSSSESALPGLMLKLEKAGCAKTVVGIVVPAGYSFNLDGTSIYLTMAAIFVAQATHTTLTLGQELGILGILLLTSKGAAAVTGGGFITLAATLKSTPIPLAGLSLLIGVDRFMSEARAITNLIGNTVATIVVSKWENEFDAAKGRVLSEKRMTTEP
jgi:aerobic C4-dicarboxylate transport protein